jgi:Reverse transcriptase (RNA-dependent DNA polymerase)
MYILIYDDDIIIAGNNSQFMQDLLEKLSLQFSIKDLGVLNYFLGIEVSTTPSSYSDQIPSNYFG